jgi:hypothetical protein
MTGFNRAAHEYIQAFWDDFVGGQRQLWHVRVRENQGLDTWFPQNCRRMSVLDLIKATVICGGLAWLFFNFAVLGQIAAIAVMSTLWLSYLRKTVIALRRRRAA